jgi:hypothetical protein
MLKQLWGFAAIGVAQNSLDCHLQLGPLREHSTPFLMLIYPAFALCLWTYFGFPSGQMALMIVLIFALYLTVLVAPPHQSEMSLSVDAHISHGHNPYAAAQMLPN